ILIDSNGSLSGSRSTRPWCDSASALRARRCDISKRTRRLLPGPCSGSQSIVDHLGYGDGGTATWLGSQDSNLDGRLQRPLRYHCATPQKGNRESTTSPPIGQIACF